MRQRGGRWGVLVCDLVTLSVGAFAAEVGWGTWMVGFGARHAASACGLGRGRERYCNGLALQPPDGPGSSGVRGRIRRGGRCSLADGFRCAGGRSVPPAADGLHAGDESIRRQCSIGFASCSLDVVSVELCKRFLIETVLATRKSEMGDRHSRHHWE
jgi:hypothetical protein